MADNRTVALWVLVGIAALFLITSFTGTGTGMFGWGFMMGFMWLFMLVPVLLIVLLVVLLMDRLRLDPGRPPPGEK